MVTREELSTIVDTMVAAWQVDIADRKTLYRTWWRYLADVDYDHALAALDARVVAGDRWAPRVGELRRFAIDRALGPVDWPDPEIAWQFAEDRLRDANSGNQPRSRGPVLDQAITAAMRAAGTSDGFHKHAFLKAWEAESHRFEQARYGLPDTAPAPMAAVPG
jgi:hypothetical protein